MNSECTTERGYQNTQQKVFRLKENNRKEFPFAHVTKPSASVSFPGCLKETCLQYVSLRPATEGTGHYRETVVDKPDGLI